MHIPIRKVLFALLLSLLFKKAPLPLRVRVIWFGLTDEHGRLTKEGRGLPQHPAPLVAVSGTKWILDGTPIERSGAMRQPYSDRPDTSGQLNFSEKEMEEMLRESLQSDDQLMVHVAGDRAAEANVEAMLGLATNAQLAEPTVEASKTASAVEVTYGNSEEKA